MQSHSINTKLHLTFQMGIPSNDFMQKAWESHPLTKVLSDTNIPFALAGADADISLLALDEKETVMGQCSANTTSTYWSHINHLDASKENQSTQVFVNIHRLAVAKEQAYLHQLEAAEEKSIHSAGIAVLPECRGREIGMALREQQIALCQKRKATTLFCETTNLFSAKTAEKHQFDKLASFAYKDLAVELSCPNLLTLDDSFGVWCRTLKS